MNFFLLFKDPRRVFTSCLIRYGSFIPDKIYLKLLYHLLMGHKLNLDKPQAFTEKIQWLKLYDRNPDYTSLVDKFAVKKIVGGIIGNEYIIPTLGVWDNVDDIEWDTLPNQFVLKTIHGGGSGGVVICKDKSNFDKEAAKNKLKRALKSCIYKSFREWPYKNVPRKIIAEKFLSLDANHDIPDFKWYCFNGEPVYCQVIRDRRTNETIDFYDINWSHQPFSGLFNRHINISSGGETMPIPQNLRLQIDIAKQLSHGIPFCRVDLYEVEGRTYFGEITLYPASGFGEFKPYEWDHKIGKLLNTTSIMK